MQERELYCYQCGRELKTEKGILKEDALIVKKEWGYFSDKDLVVHDFAICESCYDKWIAGFAKPVHKSKMTEVLGQ